MKFQFPLLPTIIHRESSCISFSNFDFNKMCDYYFDDKRRCNYHITMMCKCCQALVCTQHCSNDYICQDCQYGNWQIPPNKYMTCNNACCRSRNENNDGPQFIFGGFVTLVAIACIGLTVYGLINGALVGPGLLGLAAIIVAGAWWITCLTYPRRLAAWETRVNAYVRHVIPHSNKCHHRLVNCKTVFTVGSYGGVDV